MKTIKYILLSAILIGFTACNDEEDFINNPQEDLPELTAGTADFSNYVAVGASFTAGYTDGGLFIAGQENSFPNILAKEFNKIGGSTFTQPLVSDNTGGILISGVPAAGYRLVFGGAGPVPLNAFLANQGFPVPPITTEAGNNIGSDFNNFGIPGAKSFHVITPGYNQFNPYYTRIASSNISTVVQDAVAQNPTFFTLSEMGGNDVLGYATSGGTGVDQTGNFNPATYGNSDITDPNVFTNALNGAIAALTANGAKGLVTNVPYITDLSHFTTVPYNPLDPNDEVNGPALVAQIPTLNALYGALNGVYAFLGVTGRNIVFSDTEANPVVIKDKDLTDLSAQITQVLSASPGFPTFLAQFGLPPQAAPQVAALLGIIYGQSRQATKNDLFVLTSSAIIGKPNPSFVAFLEGQNLPSTLATQFAAEGVTLPLEDKWVIIPSEQMAIKTATDAYNIAIGSLTDGNPDVALVDLNAILTQASTTGISFDDYVLNTDLVTGGLVSLDGVHLTARGYALMANSFLKAIDANFDSNFEASGSLAKAGDYPTNYSPTLQ